ncbi:MAG: ribbon-helix-helix domain-containing protein [Candidatus Bathyarchaeia archaeon]
MKLITIYLPEPYLEALDELVSRKLYPHRAEAIRAAVRDLIELELRRRKGHGKASR